MCFVAVRVWTASERAELVSTAFGSVPRLCSAGPGQIRGRTVQSSPLLRRIEASAQANGCGQDARALLLPQKDNLGDRQISSFQSSIVAAKMDQIIHFIKAHKYQIKKYGKKVNIALGQLSPSRGGGGGATRARK